MVFAYPEQLKRPEGAPRHHEFRDGHAAMLLAEILKPAACNGILFNLPYPAVSTDQQQREDVQRKLSNTDLLVLATHPPMHDRALSSIARVAKGTGGPKKIVRRSGSWLEREIFNRVKPVFVKCARDEVAIRIGSATQIERLTFGYSDDSAVVDSDPLWTALLLAVSVPALGWRPGVIRRIRYVRSNDAGVVLPARYARRCSSRDRHYYQLGSVGHGHGRVSSGRC